MIYQCPFPLRSCALGMRPKFPKIARQEQVALVAIRIEEPIDRAEREPESSFEKDPQTEPLNEIVAAILLVEQHMHRVNDGETTTLKRDRINVHRRHPDEHALVLSSKQSDQLMLLQFAFRIRTIGIEEGVRQRPYLVPYRRCERGSLKDVAGDLGTERSVESRERGFSHNRNRIFNLSCLQPRKFPPTSDVS